MSRRLTLRGGRALALGLLLLAVFVAAAALAVPLYLVNRHYDEQLELLGDRYQRYQRVVASREELSARAAELRDLNARRFYLKNASPALAAGEIQEMGKAFVEASGARLISMQIQQPKDEGRYRRIGVTAMVMGNVAAIQGVLRAIESNEPYLFIDNLRVRSLHGVPAMGDTVAEGDLSVQFDVIAYSIVN